MEHRVMNDQVTIQILQKTYRKAESLAHRRHQSLTNVLDEAIELAEAAFTQQSQEEQQMELEEAAFKTLQDDLIAKHLNEYVAIHLGKVIDFDTSERELLVRLNRDYPTEVVLMRKVTLEPESELYFRSPKFV